MGNIVGPAEPVRTGIADALFGKVRQKVLALLFGHPDQSFYASEIIHWVNAGSGAVQRELAGLAKVGLVTVSRVGRQKHYQANEGSPIFSELRGIVIKTSGLGDVLRQALAAMADDIDAAFVFGSLAQGSDTAGSDVDLFVISDRLTYAELFTLLDPVSQRLARPVNPTIYTQAELARRIEEENPFLAKVLAQPRIWILGDDESLPT